MAQFVSFDPNAKVRGTTILTYVAALGEAAYPILEKHGLIDIEPDAWYPLQPLLDALKEIYEGDFSAVLDMVHIGMKIPEHVIWPPEIQTLEDALFSIDVAYHMNHADGEVGFYQATQVNEREIEMVCQNPYPCDFDYGLLYAIAQRYLPPDGDLIVFHDENGPCRKYGDDSCTYHITW